MSYISILIPITISRWPELSKNKKIKTCILETHMEFGEETQEKVNGPPF